MNGTVCYTDNTGPNNMFLRYSTTNGQQISDTRRNLGIGLGVGLGMPLLVVSLFALCLWYHRRDPNRVQNRQLGFRARIWKAKNEMDRGEEIVSHDEVRLADPIAKEE